MLARSRFRVGQQDILPASMVMADPPGITPAATFPTPSSGPDCPLKVVSQQLDLGDGEGGNPPTTGTATISTPGMFCPHSTTILVYDAATGAELDLAELLALDLYLVGIDSGIRRQLLSGSAHVALWSRFLDCCPVAQFDCLCMPGVTENLAFVYTPGDGDPVSLRIFIVVRGEYRDVCDGQAIVMPPQNGRDKILATNTLTIPPGAFREELIAPGGTFCMRDLFISGGDEMYLTNIAPGIERYMLGRVPIDAWGYDSRCCPVDCAQCTCSPSQPLVFEGVNESGENQLLHITAIGPYQSVC